MKQGQIRFVKSWGGKQDHWKMDQEGRKMILTLTVLVASIDAQWEGMGDVGSALLPPCPTIRVLSYSN